MSEMVDRVARAIYAALGYEGDGGWHETILRRQALGIGDGLDNNQLRCIAAARAAIEAMREPTPGMIDAGARQGRSAPSGVKYRAMIDAALQSEEMR